MIENENQLIIFLTNKHFLYTFKIIFISVLLLYYNNNNSHKYIHFVELDNKIESSFYEKDMQYNNFDSNIKIFSIYYPEFTFLKIQSNNCQDLIRFSQNYNNLYFDNNIQSHLTNLNYLVRAQIKLASNHGINGFGIIYYLINKNVMANEVLNIFIKNQNDSLQFFIIFKECNFSKIILNSTNYISLNDHLEYLKNYILSSKYININQKPVIGFWKPFNTNNLLNLRIKSKEIGIGDLYLININEENFTSNTIRYFDGFTELKDFPSESLFINESLKNVYYFNYYYDLIKNKIFSDNEILNINIFKGTSSEKLYQITKHIISLAKAKRRNNFILINAWNDFKGNYFLEPNEIYGYSYLNSISKAILGVNLSSQRYCLDELNIKTKIAIQAHIFYEDLISEIINKINNIPFKFHLYISTISFEMKEKIINIINNLKLKFSYIEINIFKNKGRDVFPFLNQLKSKIKNYKYICHVHTKKSSANPNIGFLWRNYLFNNLLGDENIISEILESLENSKTLGMIFPETYYLVYNETEKLNSKTKKYINFVLKKIFPGLSIGKLKDFPAGNMFWSRVEAIFQLFTYDFNKYFPNENEQTNDTIMHGIERFWLYLVKLNGFYYKVIFKRF